LKATPQATTGGSELSALKSGRTGADNGKD